MSILVDTIMRYISLLLNISAPKEMNGNFFFIKQKFLRNEKSTSLRQQQNKQTEKHKWKNQCTKNKTDNTNGKKTNANINIDKTKN